MSAQTEYNSYNIAGYPGIEPRIYTEPTAQYVATAPPHLPDPPKLVCWDMDGTLMDSERIWLEVNHDMAGEYWNTELGEQLRGAAIELCGLLQHTKAHVGNNPTHAGQLVEAEALRRLEANSCDFMSGAYELAQAFKRAGISQALVTASPRRFVHHVQQKLGQQFFVTIVSSDDVSVSKPNPESYLTACERCGVAPANALALEDSPAGIRAAIAAGLATIGIGPHAPQAAHVLPGDPPTAAATAVESLADLDITQVVTIFTKLRGTRKLPR